jgi:hypothetical protein
MTNPFQIPDPEGPSNTGKKIQIKKDMQQFISSTSLFGRGEIGLLKVALTLRLL